jgi:integrase
MAEYKYRKTFTDQRGKRHTVYANTLKERDRKIEEAKKKYNSDTMYVDSAKLTLNQYFYDEWTVDRLQKNIVKGSTIAMYKSRYKTHVEKSIGEMRIQAISQRQLEFFQRRLLENGVSDKSCKYIMNLLKNIFNGAKKSKIVKENPCRDIDIVRPKETAEATENKHRALTKEEQHLFMSELKGDYYYEFIALMLQTGMRQGEVAALTYQDVDLKNGVIYVNKTVTRNENAKVITGDTPKTKKSKRPIFIDERPKEIIKSQMAKNEIIAIDGRLFKTPRVKIVLDKMINDTIKRTLKRVKEKTGVEIEYFSSHALRDTYATRFLEQEKDLKTLQKNLGHKNFSMTADLYAHVLDDTQQEAAKRVYIDIG